MLKDGSKNRAGVGWKKCGGLKKGTRLKKKGGGVEKK